MIKHLINQAPTPDILIALDRFSTGRLPKYLRKRLSPDLERYSFYTYTPGSDAELVGYVISKEHIAIMCEAVKKLNKPMHFGKIDGVLRIIYQCTKEELLNVL